jgi:hypothetical protein
MVLVWFRGGKEWCLANDIFVDFARGNVKPAPWKRRLSMCRMKDMADIAATQKQDVCIGALRQLFGQVYSGVEAAGMEGFPACGQLNNPWRMHLVSFGYQRGSWILYG